MAIQTQYWLQIGFVDSRKKTGVFEVRLTDADGAAWLAAADAAARDATQAGVLADRVADLSEANRIYTAVVLKDVDDAAVYPAPDDQIYLFDKLTVQYQCGLDHYVVTIPARDDAEVNVGDDGVTVILTGAGASAETTAFVSAFNNAVEGKNGVAATVTGIYVSS